VIFCHVLAWHGSLVISAYLAYVSCRVTPMGNETVQNPEEMHDPAVKGTE